MTAPDPTGKRGKLTAARIGLSGALAAAIAAGVLLVQGGPTPPAPVIPPTTATAAQYGCPASTPGALVLRFADSTSAGLVQRTDVGQVVVCGPALLPSAMKTYVNWVAAGPCPCRNGPVSDTTTNPYDKIILSPADTSAVAWDAPGSLLTTADSLHWIAPASAQLRWKLMGWMIYDALSWSNVSGISITTDTIPPPLELGPPGGVRYAWWSFVPARGMLLRTALAADSLTAKQAVLGVALTRYAQ